jgi:hypothetical protein
VTGLRPIAAIGTLACCALVARPAGAQAWQGFVDAKVELSTADFHFGAPGGDNENYYDGDFADIDGDYRMDRAVISRFGLLWNSGGGRFVAVSTQRVRGDGTATAPMGAPTLSGYRFGDGYAGNDAVQWADVDGDGDPDSVQGGNGEPSVIQRNAHGRFTEMRRYPPSALNVVLTDVERDGDVDLVLAHAFCSNRDCGGPVDFRLAINDGTGAYADESIARGLPYLASRIVGAVSGDVDADGDFDIVLLDGARRTVVVAVNDGAGAYTERLAPFARPLAELTFIGSGFSQIPNLGDVDGDGDLDLVLVGARNSDPDVGARLPVGIHPNVSHVVMVNDGAGNFVEESATRWRVGTFTGVLVADDGKLADLDHDGDLDFVAFNKPGLAEFFQVFENDGAGVFTWRPDLDPFPWEARGKLGVDVDVSDIDGDGAYDVWIGIANLPPNPMLNRYRTAMGLPADEPRSARLVGVDGAGVTLSWQHPTWAAVNRHYRVLRTPADLSEPRDRRALKVIALSEHEDDSFVAPITRFTTTEALGDPDVTLDGATGTVTFTDRTAAPGVTYRYSIVHVGTERNASLPTREIIAGIADPDPTAPDVEPPELRIVSPDAEEWGRHPRIVVDYGDGRSGVDLASLAVSFDQPLGTGDPGSGGLPAGANLADRFARRDAGTYVYRLGRSLALPPDALVTMTASVADMAGNVATASVRFYVSVSSGAYPVAAGAATPREGSQVVDFDGSASRDTDPDVNGVIAGLVQRWEWAFGDGTTAEGRSVSHRYRQPGAYTVRLVVVDNEGGVDAVEQPVGVLEADPDTDGDGLTDGEELDRRTNPDLADTDGDGTGDAADCRPLDGTVELPAGEVAGLRVRGRVATLLTWVDGSGTWGRVEHDVVRGALPDILRLGIGGASTCAVRGGGVSLVDSEPALPGGTFYLVRAATECGSAGAWGTSSDGAARVIDACGPR